MPTWRGKPITAGPLAVLRTEQTGTPLRTERDNTPFEPVRDEDERPPESTIVQSTIYDDGYTLAEPASIRETFEHLRKPDRRGNPVAWIGMTHPRSRPSRRSSTCTLSPSRTRSSRTSGRRRNATAAPSSSSCAPPPTTTRRKP